MNLPKAYEPKEYESDIYALWVKSNVFKADPKSSKEHFSISMPPPNETGTLSIGHALFLTLQDIMARHARGQGKDVLWLPGTDHAALPVNAIIEKQLTDAGTSKHEIGREEFLRITVEFVGKSRETMINQMRAIGASADWTRLRYTLDDALNRCVNETFIAMYNDGLIYRGNRIVNWDPKLETNVSDDEVVYQTEKGKFYTFKYGPFEIGTARPETKFGDKYVVMHPDDDRYKQYKDGDTFETEWINGPITATIIKDEAADPNFGTGVMTITPWHSVIDFEIAERHGLDKEQIIDFHGKLLGIAGEFAGESIEEARPKIVEKLKNKGLLIKEDDNYVHNVAVNERGKGIIEPQIRLQWFVDVNKPVVKWKGKNLSLKQVLQSVIREEDIELIPHRFEKVYYHWIDNLRDWCISRQIWWGHRIPVWYRHDTDGREETYVGITPPTDTSEGWNEWEQDPDTLDTWFSSALWTWSTLVDQNLANDYSLSLEEILSKSLDFQTYHPTSIMETGWDILFFWVARMILATTYMTKEVPFKSIYLHGMVRAEDGKKMSKSRPDSIVDPLTVIDQYGADALRLALLMGVSPGNDQNWGSGKIEANRRFCNKLWNIARYIEGVIGSDNSLGQPMPNSAADDWILNKIRTAQTAINKDLDSYHFAEAYDKLYHFVWDDLADWYIEASKAEPNLPLLRYALTQVLMIAHPFAPFVTETIWQTLGWEDSILASTVLPRPLPADLKKAADFEEIITVVSEVRYIIKSLHADNVTLYYSDVAVLTANAEVIKKLTGLKAVTEVKDGTGLFLTSTKFRCWLDIDTEVTKTFASQLKVKSDQADQLIKQLEARLKNQDYINKAPGGLVAATKDQLEKARELKASLEKEISRFS